MVLIEAEVKNSPIAQKGVFSKQFIKKGTIVSLFMLGNMKIMTEQEYQSEQEKGNTIIIKTACRYVGKYFLYGDQIAEDEHFNHSFTPNILYHCGICFALCDIEPGQELTMNYHFLFAVNDVFRFTDSNSGRLVDGLNPTKSIVESAKELIALLEGTDLLDN